MMSKEGCNAKIVIELTNRFDWEIGNRDGLFELVREVVERDEMGRLKYPNLYWVVNNPWEERYLYLSTGAVINARLIRPVGYSSVKLNDGQGGDPTKAATVGMGGYVRQMLAAHNVPHTEVGNPYGGPEGLKTYKVYVEFAYQVSTMKMYENLAAGVVTLTPSPEFFEVLVR
ncbi:hypothetical protein HDU76_008397 [Blyttiomyces sp. JEL0837]|nr:hypothetical protein HDU76_008397 [Blyttiomyces sp. JEL0837]